MTVLRESLLQEICAKADELKRVERPETALMALKGALCAAFADPLSGGKGDERTSSMLRRCAVDCSAWGLLALEALDAPLGRKGT